MRITIDYDPSNQNFSVLVDRGTLSNGWPPGTIPPPYGAQFQELTEWLNNSFNDICVEKFKDQSVAAVRFKYDPKNNIAQEMVFTTKIETPPAPPSFIK
jgi:hypothetical protein